MHVLHIRGRMRFFQICVLSLLMLLSVACSSNAQSKQISTAAPHSQKIAASPSVTTTPAISTGSQPCPAEVQNTAYWDSIIPTQPEVSKVESVSCGHLEGVASLQALVNVRYEGTGSVLDVYVYDNLEGAMPTQIFKLQNLYNGEAKISGANTVITAEVDQNSSVNRNQPEDTLIQDLFREFQWSDGLGTLVQVSFPGIFPDLTRYQAESDQAQVNRGNQPWKLGATATAQAFGASLLHWNANASATIVSGGGAHDIQAVVDLKNTEPGSNTIQVTLARLEKNASRGIWIVTAAGASSLTITVPQTDSIIHSPVTITGTGNAFEGVIGTVTVLDHLYNDVGHASVHGAAGEGSTTFSTAVTYQTTFTTGIEEGLILLTATNNAGGQSSAAVIIKVLIQ